MFSRTLARTRALVFAALMLSIGDPARAQSKHPLGVADSLVGTWQAVSFETTDSSGHHTYPYGKEPVGLLIYTADGHMAIQVAKTPLLPNFPASYRDSTSFASIGQAELARTLDGYIAYFGSYTVDPVRRVIVHRVVADAERLDSGTDQPRPFILRGDTLILTDGRTWRNVFRRTTRTAH